MCGGKAIKPDNIQDETLTVSLNAERVERVTGKQETAAEQHARFRVMKSSKGINVLSAVSVFFLLVARLEAERVDLTLASVCRKLRWDLTTE